MSEVLHVEQLELQRGDINLRVIINHAHRHMRIMDYRVGNYATKCEYLDTLALEHGLRKAFTLVEKQDSNNWRHVGFGREAVFPAFFRTADAYVMSRQYDADGEPLKSGPPLKAQPGEQTSFEGRKLKRPDGLKLDELSRESERRELVARLGAELQGMPFYRVEVPALGLHAKARRLECWALAELDDSFGHAKLGVAPPPQDEQQLVLAAFAANSLLDQLRQHDTTNVYGLSAVGDRWSNELHAGLGFRVTGRLASYLKRGDDFVHALVWHLRLTSR